MMLYMAIWDVADTINNYYVYSFPASSLTYTCLLLSRAMVTGQLAGGSRRTR